MPPPHPNQTSRYPPGKEGAQQPQYPTNYPSPAQQGPQQRVPPYGKICASSYTMLYILITPRCVSVLGYCMYLYPPVPYMYL